MITLTDISETEENLFITDLDFFMILNKLPTPIIKALRYDSLYDQVGYIFGKKLVKVFGGYIILGRCVYCGRKDAGVGEWCGYKHCVSCGGPIR